MAKWRRGHTKLCSQHAGKCELGFWRDMAAHPEGIIAWRRGSRNPLVSSRVFRRCSPFVRLADGLPPAPGRRGPVLNQGSFVPRVLQVE